MSTKKNVVLSGVTALAIATALIAVALFSGITTFTSPPSPTTNNTSTPTSSTATNIGSITRASSSTTAAGQGILSILLTDPPNVPAGVTKVYVTYSNLAVHVSEAGNLSGWTQVKDHGTIELIGTVDVGQTLSSVKIASGDYNLIRFNISSAQVTYNGKNYTAFVPSSTLTLPIVNGIEVISSKPSATIIDITPTVMNIGSASNPEFIIRPVAKAFPVPSNEVSEQMEHEGSRMSLAAKAWWKNVRERFTANIQITAAKLTADSLSLTVKNTAKQNTTLTVVFVSPLASTLNGEHIPSALFGASIFILEHNGTLVPIEKFLAADQKDHHELANQLFKTPGYHLAAGSSATFSYNGQITLGFGHPKDLPSQKIVSGQQYLVTVLGHDALASMVVVAG